MTQFLFLLLIGHNVNTNWGRKLYRSEPAPERFPFSFRIFFVTTSFSNTKFCFNGNWRKTFFCCCRCLMIVQKNSHVIITNFRRYFSSLPFPVPKPKSISIWLDTSFMCMNLLFVFSFFFFTFAFIIVLLAMFFFYAQLNTFTSFDISICISFWKANITRNNNNNSNLNMSSHIVSHDHKYLSLVTCHSPNRGWIHSRKCKHEFHFPFQ